MISPTERAVLKTRLQEVIVTYLDSISVDLMDRETVVLLAPEMWSELQASGLLRPEMNYFDFNMSLNFQAIFAEVI